MSLLSYLKNKAIPPAWNDLLGEMARAGQHELLIKDAFEGRVRFEGDAPKFPRRLVLLAFTNRSGSNLMAEYIRQAGQVAGVGEFLNHNIVVQRAAEQGITTFPDYISMLHNSLCDNGKRALGLKASWDQIAMLLRWNIIGMFPKVTVIHVIRHYLVAQSVSYGIALQTQAWTSMHESFDIDPDLSAQDVAQSMMSFYRANLIIRLMSESFGMQRLDIGYEQIVNNPEGSVPRVLRAAGLAGPDWAPRPPSLIKQADMRNAAFVEAFYKEIRATMIK